MAHAGGVLFKIVAAGGVFYSTANALLLQERCAFLTLRSRVLLFLYFIHLQRHTTPKTTSFFNRHSLSLRSASKDHSNNAPTILADESNNTCGTTNASVRRIRCGTGVTLRICDMSSFQLFLAAVLLVPLQRFSKDPDISVDFVHLQKPPARVTSETLLECAHVQCRGFCIPTMRAPYRRSLCRGWNG